MAADYDEALGYGTPVFAFDKGEDVALGGAERAPNVCPRRRLGLRIVAVKTTTPERAAGLDDAELASCYSSMRRVLRDITACDGLRFALWPAAREDRISIDRTWQPAGCVKLPARRRLLQAGDSICAPQLDRLSISALPDSHPHAHADL